MKRHGVLNDPHYVIEEEEHNTIYDVKMKPEEEVSLLERIDKTDSRMSIRTKRLALKCLDKAITYSNIHSSKRQLTERNNKMYEMLKTNRMCVVPDIKIRSLDSLPHFEFMESVNAAQHTE